MVDSTESYERTLQAAGAAAASGDQESIEQAETLYRKALTAGERESGPFDLSLVPALTGLGAVLLQRGCDDEAAPILGRAVSVAEHGLGLDHPDVVILLNDVSRLYLKHGAHAQAEPLLQRLLEIKRVKGEDHPEVATVLASIASIRQALGRHDEAEQLWRRVLDIRTRTLAPNHIATASALEHLGLCCAARGKLAEALDLLHRALRMREITLGAEHPSLRAVRERIADLQLQASDDLLDAHDAAPAPTSRPRLSVAPHLTSPLASPLVAPAPTAVAVVEAAPSSPPSTIPYLNVLMDLKEEIEEADAAPASASRWNTMIGAISLGFRERRAAAIAAVAALTALPAIGYGVASAMRANRATEPTLSTSYALIPQTGDSMLARASAPEALRPQSATGEVYRDTATAPASATPAPARRTSESRPASRPAADEEPETPLLTQRPVVGRLDSVARSISVPSQNLGASFDVQLQASLASAQRSTAAELTPRTAARRARLIGAPPVPRYPTQLANSNIGGEVRVRFDVDTLGRPVIATFAVVASPHAALSESVKRLLSSMRFEPARSPGPASQLVTESVEMSFQFVPRVQE